MKFGVRRASRYRMDKDFPPCEGAEWREEWQRRTHMGPYWMADGKDHGESEEEGRYGTYLTGRWQIEIPDLSALMTFVGEYGSIVFDGDTITIYDDYLE